MYKVLVTGGCGYIGSHTITDLCESGFDVVSIDNFSRSQPFMLDRLKKVTGRIIHNYNLDLCDLKSLESVFEDHPDIRGVIHFAAFKSVPESVADPLLYFENNLYSLINLLRCCSKYQIRDFVFSSSCSVYGNTDVLPVTEETPLSAAESPYARTKQMGEEIIYDQSRVSNSNFILLRYFNPVGAHESSLIGEYPNGKPQNLVPVITQSAIGKMGPVHVFGDKYPTRDGSCIRDYIHVMDIAHAHTLALKYLIDKKNVSNYEIFNLGTGNGVSVLEAIKAFEEVNGVSLDFEIAPERGGDVVSIYANNEKARKTLGWVATRDLKDMMRTAWNWEKELKKSGY